MDKLNEALAQLVQYDPHAPAFNQGIEPTDDLRARARALFAENWKHRVRTEDGLREMRIEPITDEEILILDRTQVDPLLKLANIL
jgi:hypothetical protein